MLNVVGAVDVPVSLFSGLNTELSPADLPEGMSPDNQDVVFLPGSVASRPALQKVYASGLTGKTIVYEKTYVQPNGEPLTLFMDSSGIVWMEDVTNSPGTFSQININIVAPGSYCQSVTAFGREYMAMSDGLHGSDVPRQFDGVNFDRVSQDGPGAPPSTVADSATAGSVSAGTHQVVVIFQTRQGYLTKPSPAINWTAAGGKKVTITGLPIGPPNVTARILAFTGAGGDNFFYIPQTVTTPGLGTVFSTVVNDNTTTSVTLDFSDNALFAATAIDIPGNNLFGQVVLGPCLGVTAYAGRLFWWGEYNKVQNLLNMGFEGGFIADVLHPCGWDVVTAGGQLGAGDFGNAWLITGTGGQDGQIAQGAAVDNLGVPILKPNTQYSFRVWLQNNNSAVTTGTLVAEISSASSGGTIAKALIPLASIPANGRLFQALFNAVMPAVIPADMRLSIYTVGQTAGKIIVVDEAEIIYTKQPFRDTQFRVSYINNPEAFDGLTGVLGSADDQAPIQAPFVIRETFYLLTGSKLHSTEDNGTGEPVTWTVRQVASECGAVSWRAVSTGEDWAMWATQSGARIFDGGQPDKISQEIQTLWDGINQAALSSIWVKNDVSARRCYYGVPTGTATAPNQIFVLDYRELDTGTQIGNSAAIHISFTGKMIASDLARKWTKWNVLANCGEVLTRAGGVKQMCFGAGNGSAPNTVAGGFGNLYQLNPLKFTDDDYGQISPYYQTYYFVNHEAEQALQVGSHRKLFPFLAAFITGIGTITATPFTDAQGKAWIPTPAYPLSATIDHDLEWGLNVTAERVSFKWSVAPLTNTTDVQFNLQKMVVTLKPDPISPVRGAI